MAKACKMASVPVLAVCMNTSSRYNWCKPYRNVQWLFAQGRLSVPEMLTAARLEEDHQIAEWGLVEGGHDIDIADASARISAAALFSRLNR